MLVVGRMNVPGELDRRERVPRRLALGIQKADLLRGLVELILHFARIVDRPDERPDGEEVSTLLGGQLDIGSPLEDFELGFVRGPALEPGSRELDTPVQVSQLRIGQAYALFLLGLSLGLDAWDLEPARDRREADAEARRVWRGRYLGEPPGLPEV